MEHYDDEEDDEKPREKPQTFIEKAKTFLDSREFTIGYNYFVLIVVDFASLASISKLLLDTHFPVGLAFGIGFGFVVILDIISETVILYFHDLQLLERYSVEHRSLVIAAQVTQTFCTLCWIFALIYMITLVNLAQENCTGICTNCNYTSDAICELNTDCVGGGICVNSSCYYNYTGECTVYGSSAEFSTPLYNLTTVDITSCFSVVSRDQCISNNPELVDCVLLALVLLDGVYATIQMWFKKDVTTMALPDSVFFTCALKWKKDPEERRKVILEAIGKMEFGTHWTLDDFQVANESSPLIGNNDNKQIPLEIDPL